MTDTPRTLLITGASSGIGAATARAAAAAGWHVALAARSRETLSELTREIGADRSRAIVCDVRDAAEVEAAVAEADRLAPLGAVFANAGLGATVPGSETGEIGNWREMVDTNIWGLLLTVRFALPKLRATTGQVILTGSQAGRRAIKGSVYGATKWFVHGFAENLSQEMAEWGGRCTLISPGMVDTPFFDTPKPGALTPEDVAGAVVYALAQPARVNVGEVHLSPRM
ncbi:MAG: SDR family oxidoreductase [Paracoccaceae bacterium]